MSFMLNLKSLALQIAEILNKGIDGHDLEKEYTIYILRGLLRHLFSDTLEYHFRGIYK